MNNNQSKNVVALLQRDPLFYRNFGPWWWHVKAELKRNGFDKAQLSGLGSFTDASVAPIYEGMSTKALDDEAFTHQWNHTFHKYNNNTSFTPDGEVYQVQDQDVE
jgi:hypothetical protein